MMPHNIEAEQALLGEEIAVLDGGAISQRGSAAELAAAELAPLTPREREVLVLTCKGLEQTEVGAALGISRKTVEVMLASARRRLGMRTIELAVLAAKAGWV